MVSWETVKTFGFLLLPLILPRALASYRWLRATVSAQFQRAQQIRPLSQPTTWALRLLFLSAAVAFLSTFPTFAPSNIFVDTRSRLQTTSTGVLFARLAAVRPLTSADERLRRIFGDSSANLASGSKFFTKGGDLLNPRFLYAHYGPGAVLSECPLASPRDNDAPLWYLLYALPSLLVPHVIHLVVLGLATSSALLVIDPRSATVQQAQHPNGVVNLGPATDSPARGRWRFIAATLGTALAVFEIYFIATVDNPTAFSFISSNSPGSQPQGDFIYWHMRVYRGLSITLIDALLGWAIWLQATGRAFHSPLTPPTPERALQAHTLQLTNILTRLRALSVLRNGVARSEPLRAVADDYWRREDDEMRIVLEDPEVVAAIRTALAPHVDGTNAKPRVDLERVEREAREFVDRVVLGASAGAGSNR